MNKPVLQRDPGSFRDPGGAIFNDGARVLRTVMPHAEQSYRAVRDSGLYDRLTGKGWLLDLAELDRKAAATMPREASFVLEHPRLPLVSYPYEWSFEAHKRAALLHLDVHLEALDAGFTLSDATAYNIQFQGARPVFIDHLSLRPYRDGEVWAGHRQFCMQFLNPLVMHAKLGVRPNAWFRGALEGIAPEDLARLLPRRHALSWTLLSHVILQGALQRKSGKPAAGNGAARQARLSATAFKGILTGLRGYIAKLKVPDTGTEWSGYADDNSYGAQDARAKADFVAGMVRSEPTRMLWDIGCNTGDYAAAALEAGAESVVGWDFDQGALDKAFVRAERGGLDFLPLWLDAANPSPAQGWGERERQGFAQRSNADALTALAFVHHIAIGRNVPLEEVVDWLVSLAPRGVIEFPSKADPMVQRLLTFRDIPFDDYTEAAFLAHVQARARIVSQSSVNGGTRLLVWYDRRRA